MGDRNTKYYEMYVFTPTYMIVFVAYLSFYISRYAAPARVGVVMISLLSLINLSNGISNWLPRGNKDCWLLTFLTVAQAFVFFAMFQFAVVNMLTRIEHRIRAAIHKQKQEAGDYNLKEEDDRFGLAVGGVSIDIDDMNEDGYSSKIDQTLTN